MKKKRLLFVGDFACATGFGTVNEALLSRVPTEEWDVFIIGINATGDPHHLRARFPYIYPAALGGDIFGVNRLAELAPGLEPDLIVLHQDSWNVVGYIEALKSALGPKTPPVIAYCPPDAPNQYSGQMMTGEIDLLLTPTQFGLDELRKGGYDGTGAVLPYGVDPIFRPGNQQEARKAISLPAEWANDFIVGRADRNAPRKRYDLTLRYWKTWWDQAGRPENARLLVHCASPDSGWNLDQLAHYYGYDKGRIVRTDANLDPRYLWPRKMLPNVYQSWDVHFSTTLGEGAGLVAIESACCGIPQLLPRWSAYAEIFKDTIGAVFMRCTDTAAMTNGINTIGGIASETDAVVELNYAYDMWQKNTVVRPVMDTDRYDWDAIGRQFVAHCESVLRREVTV